MSRGGFWLAAEADTVMGRIFLSPVVIGNVGRRVVGKGLAPMAILPDRQRQGPRLQA